MKQITAIFVGYVILYSTIIYASELKITPEDITTNDNFGYSVSLNGDTFIVGAYGKNQYGDFSGAAYVFIREGSQWKQQAKLVPDDGYSYDYFGWSVAIDGDVAIIGAPGMDDGKLLNVGGAYIFVRQGDEWHQQKKLWASDRSPNDLFGYSVAISGNYAIIGAPEDDDGGRKFGSAYIFYFDGTQWIQQTKLKASDGAIDDMFGCSVSIFGDYAVIGAKGNDDKGSASGSAYIFAKQGLDWKEKKILVPSDGKPEDYFGASVSIYNNFVIIGAYGRNSETGIAYVYQRNGDLWEPYSILRDIQGKPADKFGYSVSISATHAVVGAYGKNTYKGASIVFGLDGTVWKRLSASDGTFADKYGYAVSISNNYVLCGANGDSDNGNSSGSAYIYVVEDSANLPPTLSNFSDIKTKRNVSVGPIPFTIDDPETPASQLSIQLTSDQWSLVQQDKIILGGQDKNRTLTIIPETDAFGLAVITITVGDGQNFVSKSFKFIVNDPPMISSIPDQIIKTDATTGAIPFTIDDPETNPNELIIYAKTSNPLVVPESHVVIAGTGKDRTVTVTPIPGTVGLASITIFVSDGIDTVSEIFDVRVSMPNTPPTISVIPDQTIWEDTPSGEILFKINDLETSADKLILSALTSHPNIIAISGIIFGGTNKDRSVKIIPNKDAFGTVIITIIVNDGVDIAATNFTVIVKPVNDRPEISPIADVFIDVSSSTHATVLFRVTDVETPADQLIITVESSNLQVLPISSFAISGTGENRTLTITPVPNMFGTSDVTICADDGNLIGKRTFKTTVNPENSPPTISPISDMTIRENTSTGTINFTVSDRETSADLLQVTASSSNPSLVPESNIILGGFGSNRAIHITPTKNSYGEAIITIYVKDIKDQAQTSFKLTVIPIIHKGDINNNRTIDLEDAIIGLQLLVGIIQNGITIYIESDVDNNNVIGMEEIIYILQQISRIIQ